MTTPTDPTTLRTALEALLEAAKAFRGRRPVDWNDPTEKPLTDALIAAHALLATPAPAADEARAGTCIVCGLHRTLCTYYDRHPFQPAPTPAPPTPPAPEERCGYVTLSNERCGRPTGHIAHRPQSSRYDHDFQTTPPATEPVAALAGTEWCDWHGFLGCKCTAARAEVDAERLARALHEAEVDCWPSVDDCHSPDNHRRVAVRLREYYLAARPGDADDR